MNYKEDDIVLCTVKNIEGATVLLELEDGSTGSMALSEVSPGRIRNIREFIVPNKRVVCKILRVHNNHVELSLRRVTAKEREEKMDKYDKEKVFSAILKSVLKERFDVVFKEIVAKHDLADFFDQLKENPQLIEKFVNKEELSMFEKVLSEKREKEKEIKRIIQVKTMSESGISDLKSLLNVKDAEIRYLGSSRFSILLRDKDPKRADSRLEAVVKDLKDKAKKLKVDFEVK